MTPHETTRYLRGEATSAARSTRAFWRGNVDSLHADGRPIVALPNGALIIAEPSRVFDVHTSQSVHMLRQGVGLEVFAPGPYGGGLGAPFDAP